jgi:hypothetical protein
MYQCEQITVFVLLKLVPLDLVGGRSQDRSASAGIENNPKEITG